MGLLTGLVSVTAAGAAGTTALSTVTCLDLLGRRPKYVLDTDRGSPARRRTLNGLGPARTAGCRPQLAVTALFGRRHSDSHHQWAHGSDFNDLPQRNRFSGDAVKG
jgi:hypothetical protein